MNPSQLILLGSTTTTTTEKKNNSRQKLKEIIPLTFRRVDDLWSTKKNSRVRGKTFGEKLVIKDGSNVSQAYGELLKRIQSSNSWCTTGHQLIVRPSVLEMMKKQNIDFKGTLYSGKGGVIEILRLDQISKSLFNKIEKKTNGDFLCICDISSLTKDPESHHHHHHHLRDGDHLGRDPFETRKRDGDSDNHSLVKWRDALDAISYDFVTIIEKDLRKKKIRADEDPEYARRLNRMLSTDVGISQWILRLAMKPLFPGKRSIAKRLRHILRSAQKQRNQRRHRGRTARSMEFINGVSRFVTEEIKNSTLGMFDPDQNSYPSTDENIKEVSLCGFGISKHIRNFSNCLFGVGKCEKKCPCPIVARDTAVCSAPKIERKKVHCESKIIDASRIDCYKERRFFIPCDHQQQQQQQQHCHEMTTTKQYFKDLSEETPDHRPIDHCGLYSSTKCCGENQSPVKMSDTKKDTRDTLGDKQSGASFNVVVKEGGDLQTTSNCHSSTLQKMIEEKTKKKKNYIPLSSDEESFSENDDFFSEDDILDYRGYSSDREEEEEEDDDSGDEDLNYEKPMIDSDDEELNFN